MQDRLKYDDNKDKRGVTSGDTIIEGFIVIKKDGSKKFVQLQNPIIYKTAEENNKKQNGK